MTLENIKQQKIFISDTASFPLGLLLFVTLVFPMISLRFSATSRKAPLL